MTDLPPLSGEGPKFGCKLGIVMLIIIVAFVGLLFIWVMRMTMS